MHCGVVWIVTYRSAWNCFLFVLIGFYQGFLLHLTAQEQSFFYKVSNRQMAFSILSLLFPIVSIVFSMITGVVAMCFSCYLR